MSMTKGQAYIWETVVTISRLLGMERGADWMMIQWLSIGECISTVLLVEGQHVQQREEYFEEIESVL